MSNADLVVLLISVAITVGATTLAVTGLLIKFAVEQVNKQLRANAKIEEESLNKHREVLTQYSKMIGDYLSEKDMMTMIKKGGGPYGGGNN